MTDRHAIVRPLPARQLAPGIPRRVCKRPLCGNEIGPPAGRSRPREFCCDDCRKLYQRERDQVRNNLLEAHRLALQYEVDDSIAAEDPPQQRRPAELTTKPGALPAAMASYLALSLVAQALEAIRVDLEDGQLTSLEEAMARISRAKEEGDRLLRAYGGQPPA